MTEAAKLKPCPFCGEVEGLYPGYRGMGAGKPYQIDCCGCGIDFEPRDGMDVIEAWNRRDPAFEEQERLVETLAAALEEAEAQIEHLHALFKTTGSGNAVLARARTALAQARKG